MHESKRASLSQGPSGACEPMLTSGYGTLILAGIVTTLAVGACSFALGCTLGLALACGRLSSSATIRTLASAYVTIVRGIPELLLILVLYFGGTALLTSVAGRYVEVNGFTAGVSALSIVCGAYAAEVFRASILAIPSGQSEASRALGLSRLQSSRLVVLPQLWRHALPGLGNLWLVILKDTSLVSIVGLEDIMRRSTIAAGSTHQPLEYYSAAASLYLAFTLISMIWIAWMEHRASRGIAVVVRLA